jgi:hypothetical protein
VPGPHEAVGWRTALQDGGDRAEGEGADAA